MITFSENLEANEKVILKYLTTSDDEYKLRNENNELINREKLLKLIRPNFFNNAALEEICRVMKLFLSEYGKIPNATEIAHMLKIKNSEVTKDELDLIFGIVIERYSPDFFYKYLKTFVLTGNLDSTLMGVMALVLLQVLEREIITENLDMKFHIMKRIMDIL